MRGYRNSLPSLGRVVRMSYLNLEAVLKGVGERSQIFFKGPVRPGLCKKTRLVSRKVLLKSFPGTRHFGQASL